MCELIILRRSNAIEHAHIRDVDYNPKKQNIIVSLVHFFRKNIGRFLLSEEQVYQPPLCSDLEKAYYISLLFFLLPFNFVEFRFFLH
jgi:hypothetical protein